MKSLFIGFLFVVFFNLTMSNLSFAETYSNLTESIVKNLTYPVPEFDQCRKAMKFTDGLTVKGNDDPCDFQIMRVFIDKPKKDSTQDAAVEMCEQVNVHMGGRAIGIYLYVIHLENGEISILGPEYIGDRTEIDDIKFASNIITASLTTYDTMEIMSSRRPLKGKHVKVSYEFGNAKLIKLDGKAKALPHSSSAKTNETTIPPGDTKKTYTGQFKVGLIDIDYIFSNSKRVRPVLVELEKYKKTPIFDSKRKELLGPYIEILRVITARYGTNNKYSIILDQTRVNLYLSSGAMSPNDLPFYDGSQVNKFLAIANSKDGKEFISSIHVDVLTNKLLEQLDSK